MQDGERWIGCRSHWDGAHLFDDAGRPIDGDDDLRRQAAMLAPDGVVLLARCAALVSDRRGLEALALRADARAAGHPALAAWLDKIPPGPAPTPLPVQGGCGACASAAASIRFSRSRPIGSSPWPRPRAPIRGGSSSTAYPSSPWPFSSLSSQPFF